LSVPKVLFQEDIEAIPQIHLYLFGAYPVPWRLTESLFLNIIENPKKNLTELG